jgi:hypothetical protein
MSGVAWLTAVPRTTVARLGEEAKLKEASRPVACDRVAGGLLFRLGPAPARGTNAEELAPYVKLATALEHTLHVPRKARYFTCGFNDMSGRYDGRAQAMQEAWHRRFFIDIAELEALFSP